MSGQYPNTFYRVAVKALIKDSNGNILLVKEKSDKWDLPGGGLDHHEEPIDGIRRELQEELGVSTGVKVYAPILIKSFWLQDKRAWLMWVVYKVVLTNTVFAPGHGVTEIEYKSPQSLRSSTDERERFIATNF